MCVITRNPIIDEAGPWAGFINYVPGTGLEPARLSAIPPQGIMSTNFNTRAYFVNLSVGTPPLYAKPSLFSIFFWKEPLP